MAHAELVVFDYAREAIRGPGALRFVIQPLIAVILGIRDGRQDAKAGRVPYLFHLLTGSGQRREILREGIVQILTPLSIGFLVDIVLRFALGFGFHPLESAVVGVTLVGFPYVLARSAAGRLARR